MMNIKEYYPTPSNLIEEMLFGIKFDKITTILEPSAGKGDIVDALTEIIKVRGSHHIDIDTIEIDSNLQHILKGKGYKIIHDDFLSLKTFKLYDLIIMNPPFSSGDKHLLKALEMQQNGGQVICILNAETLRNAYTNTRKDLIRKLEDYNAEIQYISNAFIDAERQTSVEIALIKCTIPEITENSSIITGLKNQERYEIPVENESQLTQGEFLKNIVERYNFEVQVGIKLINEYHAMQPYLLKTLKESTYDKGPIITLSVNKDKTSESTKGMVNSFIKQVRYKYWEALFASDMFNQLFTSNLREIYHKKIVELENYDFSIYNIEQIKAEIIFSMSKNIEDTIIKLFDDFSHKHHWLDETSKNIHYYNGWKTNKAWIINKKVITPFYGAFGSYSWEKGFQPTNYAVYNKLSDIEKVFNYLDKGETPEYTNLKYILEHAERQGQTRKIETKYFLITFFKKGTCHIEFKDLELLKKFNIFGSQRKAWLPPCYGKKSYRDMNLEEKSIIDEFEGEKEYEKVMLKKESYIIDTVGLLMIA